MILKQIKLENYTVFHKQDIEFDEGINIFIGENGTGKTHLLKLLYSACQAVEPRILFSHKVVMTMLPDDYRISRLVTRRSGNAMADVQITAADPASEKERSLFLKFHSKTKRWEADVSGESEWEEAFHGVSSIFIPAKEILSNSYNLNAAAAKDNVRFDDTYLDILNAAKIDISSGEIITERDSILKDIEHITGGAVFYDVKKDEFYIKSANSWQEFNLVAEGIRKMALVWQLVKNGTLEKGSVLFWDEPEANINPSYISIIVEILLALQRRGVQIFVSTHDYMLASYFEVRKAESDRVLFHSFALTKDVDHHLWYESGRKFGDLKSNAITEAFNRLLDEIYDL